MSFVEAITAKILFSKFCLWKKVQYREQFYVRSLSLFAPIQQLIKFVSTWQLTVVSCTIRNRQSIYQRGFLFSVNSIYATTSHNKLSVSFFWTHFPINLFDRVTRYLLPKKPPFLLFVKFIIELEPPNLCHNCFELPVCPKTNITYAMTGQKQLIKVHEPLNSRHTWCQKSVFFILM